MRIAVVGAARGDAHMILDAITDGLPHEVVAFLDDDPTLRSTFLEGIPVIGATTEPQRAVEAGAEGAVLFLGRSQDRERLAQVMAGAGLALPVIVHPRAYVAPSASLGRGTFVGAMATISSGAAVGELVVVAPTALVSHHVQVGDLAQVSPGGRLGGRSRVGQGAFIGLGATVLSERVVGDDAVVGAGAVVISDVAPGTTVAGVPAHPIEPRA